MDNFEELDAAETYKTGLQESIAKAKINLEAAIKARDEAFAIEIETAKEKGLEVPEEPPSLKEKTELDKLEQEMQDQIDWEKSLDEDEEEILLNLGKFMKYNKQL